MHSFSSGRQFLSVHWKAVCPALQPGGPQTYSFPHCDSGVNTAPGQGVCAVRWREGACEHVCNWNFNISRPLAQASGALICVREADVSHAPLHLWGGGHSKPPLGQ